MGDLGGLRSLSFRNYTANYQDRSKPKQPIPVHLEKAAHVDDFYFSCVHQYRSISECSERQTIHDLLSTSNWFFYWMRVTTIGFSVFARKKTSRRDVLTGADKGGPTGPVLSWL